MTRPAARLLAFALVIPMVLAAACDGDEGGDDDRAAATTSTTSSTSSTGASVPPAESGGAAGAGVTTTTTDPAPGATDSADDAGVIELEIVGGSPQGGIRRETVKLGAQVTLRVTSDAAGEIHVHTYDLKADLVPGQSADLTFLAKIPGVFEVELENLRKKVLELEVRS